MINDRFKEYFKHTFFKDKDSEFFLFLDHLEHSLPRTIRIAPEKETEVTSRLESDGWILHPTPIDRVFSVDRREDFNPFERRLGMSFDHLIGNFYIQELAAAHPVDLVANSTIHTESFVILDMSSSPGGKTTQLAEYFPNSFIIANEPSRERIAQLRQNLERMGTPNVGITLYPGQQWKHFYEVFDRILVDAPCSGEGTLYKGTDATKNWHIKSIKQIAALQKKLVVSALVALKTGGEMVYSTCALNDIENEGILEWIIEKYGDAVSVEYEKKFWPHIDKTGGFFMAKIIKHKAIGSPSDTIKNTNTDIVPYKKRIPGWQLTSPDITLFVHQNKLLACKNAHLAGPLLSGAYLMRFGEHIGYIDKHSFTPTARTWRYLMPESYTQIELPDEEALDAYLRGALLESDNTQDAFVLLSFKNTPFALETLSGGYISNTFPKDWYRK